jgi:hypothetical protein
LLLVRRDWILNRVPLSIAVFVFATFQILLVQVPIDLPYIWVFITCTWAAFLTIGPLGRDEKYRGAAWSCTLPVSRREIVRARYIGAWSLAAVAYLVAVAVALISPGSKVSIPFALALDTLLIGAVILSAILAFMLPCVVRYGMKGLLVLLLPINIFLPMTFVVSKATGTQDSLEGSFLTGLQALAALIAGIRDGLSRPLFYIAVLMLLFAINWASYRIAVALFLRREL